MRTETIVKKEASEIKMPVKSKKELSRNELYELVVKLAEIHGLM